MAKVAETDEPEYVPVISVDRKANKKKKKYTTDDIPQRHRKKIRSSITPTLQALAGISETPWALPTDSSIVRVYKAATGEEPEDEEFEALKHIVRLPHSSLLQSPNSCW